jgi:autotransporter-associated beta strand protein
LRNFVFNGGTLKPSADDTNFFGAKVTGVVSTGGALIDSNNKTVTINSAMIHDSNLVGADGGLTKSGLGTVTLAGNITYNGPTSVTGGRLALASNLTTSSSVSISNNGVAEIVASLPATSTRIVKTGGISVTGTGKINVQDNKIISTAVGATGTWTGSNYTGITGLIASGKGTGNFWDGSTGIITTQSQAVGSNYTSIGVAKASDVRPATATATDLWGGQTITGSDTLVMYTYGGDATLDGKINIDDYVKIDSGIAANLTGWVNGDFNYDGKVNIDDYTTVIDANVGNQNGVFPTASGSGGPASAGPEGVSAVPEPASLSLLALGAVSLLGRRRRRHAVEI